MEYLRNTWYAALWSEDLKAGELFPRTILGENLVFFRREDGAPSVIGDICPHRFAPLHKGRLLPGDRVRCPYHGLEFDPTGICVKNPHGSGTIPAQARVQSHPLVERHGIIWLWPGEKAADPSRIPDYSYLDEGSGYLVSKRDHLLMQANYLLITDNLLDLSHASFLHEGILGNDATIGAKTSVSQEGKWLKVATFASDVPAPSLFDMLFRQDRANVDMWFTMNWQAPGCMINDAGVCPVGGAREQGAGIFGSHLLTPETETTTHYLFAAARQKLAPPTRADEDPEIRQKLTELRRIAFEEQDTPIIEAQQRFHRLFPERAKHPVLLEIDTGPVRYRRILSRLIEEEQRAAA